MYHLKHYVGCGKSTCFHYIFFSEDEFRNKEKIMKTQIKRKIWKFRKMFIFNTIYFPEK